LSCKAIRELYEQAVAAPVYKNGDVFHGDVFLGSPEYGQKVTIDFDLSAVTQNNETGSASAILPAKRIMFSCF
jgi:hypothetical protein